MNEFSYRRLDFPKVRRLVLLSMDLSRGKHLEMACSRGTRRGDDETRSFWGLVVYLRGLIERRLLSLRRGCLFLFLAVRLELILE
jgi:hypothetical protein